MNRRVWTKLLRHRGAWVGAVVTAIVVLAALFAPVVEWGVGVGPMEVFQDAQLVAPGGTFETEQGTAATAWLGTDQLGRDILVRVCYGAQKSLMIGLLSVVLACLVGVPLGLMAGYAGGWADTVCMRFVDILLAFPSILLAIVVMTALGGDPNETNVIIAVALVNVPVFARQVRGSVLVVRELDHVVASRALGTPPLRIVTRAILPNVLAPVIVLSTLGLATAILSAAGLSFLGLGVEPGIPEWGAMLTDARDLIVRDAYWAVLAPGLAITVTVLGVNLFGDALRDVLDPKGRRG